MEKRGLKENSRLSSLEMQQEKMKLIENGQLWTCVVQQLEYRGGVLKGSEQTRGTAKADGERVLPYRRFVWHSLMHDDLCASLLDRLKEDEKLSSSRTSRLSNKGGRLVMDS